MFHQPSNLFDFESTLDSQPRNENFDFLIWMKDNSPVIRVWRPHSQEIKADLTPVTTIEPLNHYILSI